MSTSNIKRKLVAILAADAVGFSRQMGVNEERTARVLAAHRAVIDGIIAFHEGRIVGTAGDSVLAEFASPVTALRCAVEIQDAIRTRNDALPEPDRMQFRIGVNLGDVIVKGDDLLGDGVNVAARLEGIAEPGGICISSSVYDQIAGKLDLGIVEIGEQQLKNIPRPIRVYRVSGSAQRPPAGAAPKGSSRRFAGAYAGGALLVAVGIAAAVWLGIVRREPAPPVAVSAPQPAAIVAAAPVPKPVAVEDESRKLAMELEARKAELAKAQADLEIARARAAAETEIAKARAAAELARARAEAAAAQRQAAAEVAAAHTNAVKARAPAVPVQQDAAQPAPQPVRSPQAVPAKRAAVAAPEPAPSAATWTGQRSCESFNEMRSFTDEVSVKRESTDYVLAKGEPGEPGYFLVRGQPQADGRLVLSGTLISSMGPTRGREIPAQWEGRLEGERYEMKGRMGRRSCMLSFARAP